MRIICTIIILFLFNSLSIAAESKITTEEDVKRIYNSIVKIFSIVPPDARTATAHSVIKKGK